MLADEHRRYSSGVSAPGSAGGRRCGVQAGSRLCGRQHSVDHAPPGQRVRRALLLATSAVAALYSGACQTPQQRASSQQRLSCERQVAGDLSDLLEKLEWARAHDTECRNMAERWAPIHPPGALTYPCPGRGGWCDSTSAQSRFCAHTTAPWSTTPPAWTTSRSPQLPWQDLARVQMWLDNNLTPALSECRRHGQVKACLPRGASQCCMPASVPPAPWAATQRAVTLVSS